MIFSLRIKQLRLQHNLTQEQMCERLYMDQSAYSRYEKGISNPSATLLLLVSNEFNVSIDWLLKDIPNQNKTEIDK
ncbi:MAG: helix-turn-helix transcriptional regulator [Chitinophagaceae bacterium]